jgi:NAD(P)-dependent dehydrogenase (short-subunit alcohol dehydrogenase family)
MLVTFDFASQTAIVTGGARGIGRAISQLLACSGADVWIWDVCPIELPGTRMALLGRQRLQHGCGVRHVGWSGKVLITPHAATLKGPFGIGRLAAKVSNCAHITGLNTATGPRRRSRRVPGRTSAPGMPICCRTCVGLQSESVFPSRSGAALC